MLFVVLNVLCIFILVFILMLNFLVLLVFLRENVLNENLIFFVYDMEFVGYYDVVEFIF